MNNPFYVHPGNDFGQGLAGLGQSIQRAGENKRQRDEEQRLKKRFEDAKAAMTSAMQSGDPNQIMQASIDYPELQKTGEMLFGFKSEQTKDIVRDTYRRVLSDPQNGADHIQKGIQAVSEAGGTPSNMMSDLGMFMKNPEAALKSIKSGFALIDPNGYKSMFGDRPDELKVGRYRQITLPDGSIATLDTATNAVTPIAEAPPVDLSILPEDMQESVARQPVDMQRKIVESFAGPGARSKEIEVSKQKEKAEEVAGKTARLIDELLANESGVKSAIGGVDELTPSLLPSTRNAEAALDDLRNMLTVDNLKLMTGVLSESDIKILRSVGASGLSGSQDRVIETLKRMKKALSGESDQQGGSDIDDLVNKYAD